MASQDKASSLQDAQQARFVSCIIVCSRLTTAQQQLLALGHFPQAPAYMVITEMIMAQSQVWCGGHAACHSQQVESQCKALTKPSPKASLHN